MPRVIELDPAPTDEFIRTLSHRVFEIASSAGGGIPLPIVQEIVENFIHARFIEPIVSVLDGGNTIRFTDQGPGIADKTRAATAGFTTATADMKRFIRGVGSGLSVVRDYLEANGGALTIEDNIGGGTVVTISRNRPVETQTPTPIRPKRLPADSPQTLFSATKGVASDPGGISARQMRVLLLVGENGSTGPSHVARSLDIALSTAYRDLSRLEELGLVKAEQGGKRILSSEGRSYIASHNSGVSR